MMQHVNRKSKEWNVKFYSATTNKNRLNIYVEPPWKPSNSNRVQAYLINAIYSCCLNYSYAEKKVTLVNVSKWSCLLKRERILSPVLSFKRSTYNVKQHNKITYRYWIYLCNKRVKIEIHTFLTKVMIKLPPILTKNVYKGSRCTNPLILNLRARWRWVVNISLRPP